MVKYCETIPANIYQMNSQPVQRISIVITVYNCDELVRRCIDSLINACKGCLPETIVVDNANLPSTQKLIESYSDFGLKYVQMPRDGGFAGANNVGYALCSREFVLLVNSDSVFHDEPFSALINFMDAHPNVSIAQGTVILKNGIPGQDGLLDDGGIFLSPWGIIEMSLRGHSPSSHVAQTPCQVYFAYGAMFMIRRGCEQQAGGFLFHDHFYAYHEEADLCHRVWLGGHEVWYVPTPVVDHAHSATFKKNFNSTIIRKRMLCNNRFSLLTCLGIRSLISIYPFFELYQLGQATIELLHGHPGELKLQLQAIRATFAQRHLLMETRQRLQNSRVLNDDQLFSHIMKTKSPLTYFWFKIKNRIRKSQH